MRRAIEAAVVALGALALSVATMVAPAHATIPTNHKVHEGSRCYASQHLHHVYGVAGIELICRGPYHHRFVWKVYLPHLIYDCPPSKPYCHEA